MGYSKMETEKKQKQLVSRAQRNKRKILVNLMKMFLVFVITFIIACAGAGFGMIKGILDNAPSIDDISIYPEGFKTIIYDVNGNKINELSMINSNRVYVYYKDIPEDFVNAFLAIEDQRFWLHNGVDVKGIMRAFVNGLQSGSFDEGASTITQQLIKNNVFNVGMGEISFMDRLNRKIQEQYLALEIEKKYTKEQIIEYYLNTIYLGRGVNGIQAASERYFGKNINELTISEMATIAGVTQNPSAYDPVIYPEQSAKRRMMVLDKMLELEYIDQAEYDRCVADNVFDRISSHQDEVVAQGNVNTYYTDAMIDQLQDELMELYDCSQEEASNMIFTGGLSVYSVQDDAIQEICDSVINDPENYNYGTKVGLDYALTIYNSNGQPKNYSTGHLINYYKDKTGNSKYNNIYSTEELARAAADEFKEAKLDETSGTFDSERVTITPQPQFSFTVMDQKTGYIKAIVGGRGEKTENRSYNRATDATRQPGSTFKILAAYLPYIDALGGSLASPFKDEPFAYSNGPLVKNWWGGSYRGYVSVRTAIKDSMNVIAVKAITEVTPELSYEYLLKVGLTTIVDQRVEDGVAYTDKTQASALGGLTDGITNLEITGAYAAIANGGTYTKPVFYSKVVDHDGKVIIDHTIPTTHQAMKPTTAWLLIDGMKSVLNGGTGGSAKMRTGISCAGKTGTTSNTYDLWFCGMTPYYTASIWMGFDSNVDMGNYNQSLHNTMWRDIMDQIATMEGQDPSLDFTKPEGISSTTLCQITGKSPGEGCPTFSDYCASGFTSGGVCAGHETVTLCSESHLRATSTCPTVETFVTEIDPATGQKKLVLSQEQQKDTQYVYTEEICTLHPEAPTQVAISSGAGEGGSITTPMMADIGSSPVFYITPSNGYTINDVLVNGQSVGPVSSYTFTNIQADATITATFKKKPNAPDPTTEAPTTEAPTTAAPTTEAPTTAAPTTAAPTTEAPVNPDPQTADLPPAQ